MKLPTVRWLPVYLGGMLLLALCLPVQAGSATWSPQPATSNWNLASNWNPNTVPNGVDDVATFALSDTTSLSLSAKTTVDSILFASDASAYIITASKALTISGAGVTNDSAFEQTLVSDNNSEILVLGSAMLGAQIRLIATAQLASGNFPGGVVFSDNTNAGQATIVANRGPGPILSAVNFTGSSTAGNAIIVNQGATSPNDDTPGATLFLKNSSAGQARITCEGGASGTFGGGRLSFADNSSAASATITINGGDGPGSIGGHCDIYSGQTATSNLIAQGGTNGGGGGTIVSLFSVAGAIPRVEVYGNGNFDLYFPTHIGSLGGDGLVFLGSNTLSVGGNGVPSVFFGVIQDEGGQMGTGGSLSKTGPEILILIGPNLYTGGTSVSEGTLVVANRSGSGTGTGAVLVSGGTLAGNGTVAGAVTVGTGGGPGAFLAPAAGPGPNATFTTQSALTLNADATYVYTARAGARKSRTDEVVASGVTINGATFQLRLKASGAVAVGTVLTAISNTSAHPIAGTFGNLADGAIIRTAGNNFQANYQGGSGNDLTLTVVP